MKLRHGVKLLRPTGENSLCNINLLLWVVGVVVFRKISLILRDDSLP